MKKLLNLLALCLMYVGANAQTVLAEVDFTTATEFTGWTQFDDTQTDGKVDLLAGEGLAITVGVQTGQLWQPQIMLLPDGSFDLEEDLDYTVVITAKFPTAGTLQINMGSWSANDQATFPVGASDEFQTIECDFEGWSVNAEGAHLLFCCGDFKGTTFVKKIMVVKGIQKPYNPANICYNFITKGKVAEVISNSKKKYKGIVEIPTTVTHEGETYTVTKIGDNAFSGCSGLTSVTIPNSMTSIGESAFNDCRSLTSVNISKSVTSIGQNAFYGCKGLTSLKVESGNQYYDSRNDCNALIETASNTLLVGGNNSTIPNGVTSIGNYAFQNRTGLTTITIPNSINSIGSFAFSGCIGLKSVTISSNLTSIDSYAFGGCTGLTSVTIPNSVNYISSYAFYGSGLTSITIPNSVTSIGYGAFANCSDIKTVSIGSGIRSIGSEAFGNCSELTDVYCMAEELGGDDGLITATDAFNGSYIDYATLHVPAASLNSYMNTEPWKNFQSKVAINDGEIPETPKCAKPEISFINGKVSFSCETEGVEYISEVTLADTHKYYDSEIELSQTYKVSVYATKANYINSDVTTREIVITGTGKAIVIGDVDGDGKVNVADHVKLSDIIMEKL